MAMETKKLETDNALPPIPVAKAGEHCGCCKTHETIKLAMIRGSGYELRNILPAWFKGLGAKTIMSSAQSESEGNVTITVYYR